MASAYLSWTPSNTETSPYIRTISVWCKRANISTQQVIGSVKVSERQFLRFDSTGELNFQSTTIGETYQVKTNAKYRDVNAWYHIVIAYDSTQGTSSDRVKMYVNGEQITSFATASYPASNISFDFGRNAYPINISRDTEDSNSWFDGSMAHFHFIDGTAYDASTFGETDATTGIWKPKTAPSVTYGTNGFFLKFENSGSMGTDSSGNGNDFTVNGSLTQTVDTPSNVFCTINSIGIPSSGYSLSSLSNGNTTVTNTSGSNTVNMGTLAIDLSTSSKWYYEFKMVSGVATANAYCSAGWGTEISAYLTTGSFADLGSLFLYGADGKVYTDSGWTGVVAPTWSNGDIIGCAIDLNANDVKWYKNGSLVYTASSQTFNGSIITPCHQWGISSAVGSYNFGNGYFGTTAVSSATSDESGLGIFEYTVPSGYYALCTKNINTQG